MAFEKGKSGNPKGSRKARLITQQLTSALNEAHAEGDKTKLRAVIDKWIELAIAGEMQAINAIADRIDGKPQQSIDTTITDERDVSDLSGGELDARIRDALRRVEASGRGTSGQDQGEKQPTDLRQLN